MAEGLRTEVHGNVGMVIMNRPPHNFLNFRQIHDIADALDAVSYTHLTLPTNREE